MLWTLFGLIIGIALAVDLGAIGGIKKRIIKSKQSEVSPSEDEVKHQQFNQALAWTIVWISLGLIFSVVIYFVISYEKMLEYITGYTLEKTLSVDNMFVFLLIFNSLAIHHKYQHRVLSIGIISAISMR